VFFLTDHLHCLSRCGPLVRSWCMRFEAKHKYFKKMAQTLNNFINIAKTLAYRHQRFMCYKMNCSVEYLHLPNSYGSGMKQLYAYFVNNAYGIIAKRHIVSELEYASNLLQSTELTANSSVLRFVTICSCIVELFVLVFCLQGFFCRYQWDYIF